MRYPLGMLESFRNIVTLPDASTALAQCLNIVLPIGWSNVKRSGRNLSADDRNASISAPWPPRLA
jgi:hypothetical protein